MPFPGSTSPAPRVSHPTPHTPPHPCTDLALHPLCLRVPGWKLSPRPVSLSLASPGEVSNYTHGEKQMILPPPYRSLLKKMPKAWLRKTSHRFKAHYRHAREYGESVPPPTRSRRTGHG